LVNFTNKRWYSIKDKFYNLESEKQERILKAAFQEFTQKKYEEASTNQIVNNAGISKGALFYYFNTKKELYIFLIKYALNYVIEEYINNIENDQTDLIEKYRQRSKLKMKAYTKNPHVFNFLGSIYVNKKNTNLPEDLIIKINKVKQQVFSNIFENIDTSLFRKDISPDIIKKLIHWSVKGYENELIEELRGEDLNSIKFEPYWDEFHEFLKILKKIYYK